MAVGTTLIGSLALAGPAATPASAALGLPTCTITLSGLPSDGIPVPGTNLTSTIVLGGDTQILALNLPILNAVVSIPNGGAIPTTLPIGALPLSSLPYTVLPGDVGSQLVGIGQISAIDPTSALGILLGLIPGAPAITSPINCTTTPTPPVVSPPVVSPPGSTTLGATPVSSTPTVAGKTKVRKTVRANLGTVQPGVVATYQWFKKRKHHRAVAIAGATGATYKIKPGIRGKRISVVVSYVKAGYSATVLSSPSRRVR